MSNIITSIDSCDLTRVYGGVGAADFNAIRQKAQDYCPTTAAKYASVSPASVDRSLAVKMGNECLAEMGPGKAFFARGQINRGIDEAFPK